MSASAQPFGTHIDYQLPPKLHNAEGKERRMGLELEFAGVSFERAVQAVAASLNGTVEAAEDALQATVMSELGEFRLELDAQQLRDKAYLDPLTHLGLEKGSATSKVIEGAVLSVAQEFVPLEVVTPPIPWSRLGELERMWQGLHDAGAEGTRSSVFRAFGLHLNPEVVDQRVETTLHILRAYLLLEVWLLERARVDFAREVSPFVRGFPEAYRRLVVEPSYQPDWQGFVADYVAHNPTRNRKLDLLPLFRHALDIDLSAEVRDWHLVKARPTYHYRLPNSEISDACWTPCSACNDWLFVERLAENAELLDRLGRSYLEVADWPLRLDRPSWSDTLQRELGVDLNLLAANP